MPGPAAGQKPLAVRAGPGQYGWAGGSGDFSWSCRV